MEGGGCRGEECRARRKETLELSTARAQVGAGVEVAPVSASDPKRVGRHPGGGLRGQGSLRSLIWAGARAGGIA